LFINESNKKLPTTSLLKILSTISIFIVLYLIFSFKDNDYFIIDIERNIFIGLTIQQILLAALFCFLVISKRMITKKQVLIVEYDIIIIFSIISLSILCLTTDLLFLLIALELQSFCFYTLASLKYNSEYSIEAGLKYFILGSFSTGFLAFGLLLVYIGTGSLSVYNVLLGSNMNSDMISTIDVSFLFIICSLLFKVGSVPFHQ